MITLHLDDTIISSLTGNELNILKFVYGHPEDVLHMSIQELARQVSYSSATILRFCKKLGYSGFAELSMQLHADFARMPLPLPPIRNKISAPRCFCQPCAPMWKAPPS